MEKWAREENKNISSCSILLISVSVGGSDLSQNGSLKSTNREEVQPKKYSPHHKSIRWKKKAHKPSSQEKEQVDGWKKSQVDEQLGQLRKLDGCAFSLLLADESTEPSWLAPLATRHGHRQWKMDAPSNSYRHRRRCEYGTPGQR